MPTNKHKPIPASVKNVRVDATDIDKADFYFIGIATGIPVPEDEILFVHGDSDDGFFVKQGTVGACLFKGLECVERYIYQLKEQNPEHDFRKVLLKR